MKEQLNILVKRVKMPLLTKQKSILKKKKIENFCNSSKNQTTEKRIL